MEWASLVFQLVAAVLMSYAQSSKQQPAKPVAFEAIDFPQADEGTPQAVVFGDCWTGDWMVLAVGNYSVEEVRSGGGGKK